MSFIEDCRKQTNKKSLCITHYKEEYGNGISIYPAIATEINHLHPSRMIADGSIKNMHSGRRFIFQDHKWQPLCNYDRFCQNLAKYDLFCMKHYQIIREKQQEEDNYRQASSSNEKNKRFKTNGN